MGGKVLGADSGESVFHSPLACHGTRLVIKMSQYHCIMISYDLVIINTVLCKNDL